MDLEAVLTQPVPPIPWAVRGLLAEQDIAIISGSGGVGKSYVLIQLALDLCRGAPFFNQLTSARPYNILYFDMEMSEPATTRRFSRMLKGNGFTAKPPNLHVMLNSDLLLNRPESLKNLLLIVNELKIDFILIDSVRRVITGDENDSRTTNDLLMAGKNLRDKSKCGIVFLAHHRKAKEDPSLNTAKESLKGNTDWRNMIDSHIAVSPGEKDHLTIFPDKSRHDDDVLGAFTVKFLHEDRASENGPFKMVFVGDAAHQATLTRVATYIRNNPAQTRIEIQAGLQSTEKIVRDNTDDLLRSGAIIRTGRGVSGDPHRYSHA